jgi:hypothetical protein
MRRRLRVIGDDGARYYVPNINEHYNTARAMKVAINGGPPSWWQRCRARWSRFLAWLDGEIYG